MVMILMTQEQERPVLAREAVVVAQVSTTLFIVVRLAVEDQTTLQEWALLR
tara:strand:- start:382 stop:534 length:153 start_codon:yes stop_codon:yes gene_type:complete